MIPLDPEYLAGINKRYSDRLAVHGDSPLTLGWSSSSQQNIRFQRFSNYLGPNCKSIVDIGCGLGDFASFISSTTSLSLTSYTGIDINPDLISIANSKSFEFPTEFSVGDILDNDFRSGLISSSPHAIVAAGIFNLNFYSDSSRMNCFFFNMIEAMIDLKPSKIIFDFLPVQRPDLYSPEDYIALYDLAMVVSYFAENNIKYLLDMNQSPNPMSEALVLIDLT